MDELHRSGELVVARAAVPHQFRPGECEHGAQSLAAPRNQMTRQRRYQRHLALHPVEDDLIDLVHPIGGQRQHGFDGAFRLFALQGDYVGRHFGLAMVCPSFLGKLGFGVSLIA